jgi:hypothetical protein
MWYRRVSCRVEVVYVVSLREMRYIHFSVGKLFLAVARVFLPPAYQNRFVLLLGQTRPVSGREATGHME